MTGGPVVEGQVGVGGEPSAGQLGGHAVRAQGAVHAAGDHQLRTGADLASGVGEGVQAPGLLADENAGRPVHAVPDGDLAGVDGVEPGEGHVGADLLGGLAPQVLQFALAEAEAAGGAGRDDAACQRGHGVEVDAGVGDGPVGRGQGELGHAVGLRDQPAGQMVARLEPGHLARPPRGIAGGVERLDAPDAVLAAQRRRPVGVESDAGGGDNPDARDHDRGHAARPSGRRSTMALWKPPKPLPTVSAADMSRSLACRGT